MVHFYKYGMNFLKLTNSKNTIFKIPKYLRKTYSQKANDEKCTEFVPFMKMIQSKRMEASRSILVQVQSAQSYKELYTYCNSIGNVQNMFHYSEGADPMHFIIVEFSTEIDVQNILNSSCYTQEYHTVPTTSQFLWFRAASKKAAKLKQLKPTDLFCENGTKIMNDDALKTHLSQCKTVSDQIEQLYELSKLNDVGKRLRFLTAKQIESTISGLFPKVSAFPFGSSVNGFGKMGCDLDIVLRLAAEEKANKHDNDGRLVYHCKASSGSERTMSQRNMETIGDLINLFLPGCTQVRRILQARVPIIKYHQQLTNIECDLSMSNMSGVYMSDFLYMMGEIDHRVRPLVFAIRKWGKEVFITNTSPGKWITNFSLTLLVLAFLQKPLISPPVLPTLNQLTKLAGSNDQFVTEDGINGTFLRDITRFKAKSQNSCSLEQLLLEFFEFYANFDFTSKAICLNEAVSITKPENSALYIVNPLERGLNVSKNVSLDELERFKIAVRNAAWLLESKENKFNEKGILTIFETRQESTKKFSFMLSEKYNRLMEVSALFESEDNNIISANNNNNKNDKIEYKNESVRKEVNNIKKQAKNIDIISHKRLKFGR